MEHFGGDTLFVLFNIWSIFIRPLAWFAFGFYVGNKYILYQQRNSNEQN